MTPQHPGDPEFSLGGKAMWFGPEVEGRRRRWLWTAFLSANLTQDDLGKLIPLIEDGTVEHVFLTEIYSNWGALTSAILPACLERGVPVTCARRMGDVEDLMDKPFFDRVDLLVRLSEEARWVARLREHRDQVSFGIPYNLVTFNVEDGIATRPEDYRDDTAEGRTAR